MSNNINEEVVEIKKIDQEIENRGLNKNKSSTFKNKKYTIGIKSEVLNEIKKLTDQCNIKQHGKTIVAQDIISHALKLIRDDDIKKIKEGSYSIQDKIMIDIGTYNEKNGATLSYDEYLAMKLKIQ